MKKLVFLSLILIACEKPIKPETVIQGKWKLIKITCFCPNGTTPLKYEETIIFNGDKYEVMRDGKGFESGVFSVKNNLIDYNDNTSQQFILNDTQLILTERIETKYQGMIADLPNYHYQKFK